MQIPGYKIERLIAEGGMASVYLAVQESLDRPVALKLLRKFDNPGQALRFFNEGKIIASFNHRNIITIYDLGMVAERHYLAMEFLQGGDLRARINAGMEPAKALELLETLANCLGFVHQKGIIHRDIKPENILFRKDDTVVLTDFGVAKLLESDTSLTMDGTTLGSPHYLSPEQAESKPLDGRADIYSLGIVFYEMLTGMKPFQGDSAIEIIIAHLTQEIPDLPPHLQAYQLLLARMTAKHPADRFASVEELSESIQLLRNSTRQRKLFKAPALRNVQEQALSAAAATIEQLIAPPQAESPEQAKPAKPDIKYAVIAAVVGISALLAAAVKFWPASQDMPASDAISVPGPAAAPAPPQPIAAVQPAVSEPLPAPKPTPPAAVAEQNPPPNDLNPLQAAALVLKEKPMTLPKLKQAYDYYQLILKKNPRHPEALRGINAIARDVIDLKAKTANFLDLAESAVKNDKLLEPEDKNAVTYYRQILTLDPENPEALQGLAAVADVFAERAAISLDNSDLASAEQNVRFGLSVKGDHSALLSLAEQLKIVDTNLDNQQPSAQLQTPSP